MWFFFLNFVQLNIGEIIICLKKTACIICYVQILSTLLAERNSD